MTALAQCGYCSVRGYFSWRRSTEAPCHRLHSGRSSLETIRWTVSFAFGGPLLTPTYPPTRGLGPCCKIAAMKRMRRPYQQPIRNHLADRSFTPAGDGAWIGFGASLSHQGLGAHPGEGRVCFLPAQLNCASPDYVAGAPLRYPRRDRQNHPRRARAAARFGPNPGGRAGFLPSLHPNIPRHFGEGVQA